ncbi:MAG: hypothetical protein JW929_11590 [Anaerolineales bacterium]|nr:hypothetical protein [Anaerolineales bacterium]
MSILRGLFGPSKDEMWSQLSREIGAEYNPGGFFKDSKVTLTHRDWRITLDTYTVSTGKTRVTYTRFRAPFVNPDGFRFNIYRKNIFSGIAKLLGTQDIEIGDSYFDDEFIIQSSSEDLVYRLLSNLEIRQMIQKQPSIHFEVKDDEGWFKQSFPEGVDELYFQTVGVITDKQRLKDLFDLFAAALDQLCRMGSGYERDPGVRLS